MSVGGGVGGGRLGRDESVKNRHDERFSLGQLGSVATRLSNCYNVIENDGV